MIRQWTAIVVLVLLVFTAARATANSLRLTMCRSTDYKNTCLESLSAAGETKDPRLLLRTAFYAAINATRKTLAATSNLRETKSMVDPIDYEICREVLEFSFDDLKKAIRQLDGLFVATNKDKRDELVSDIKTSLSGSLTFHQTCMDEIENMTTKGDNVAEALKVSGQLSSNALALLSGLTTFEAKPSSINVENMRFINPSPSPSKSPSPSPSLPPFPSPSLPPFPSPSLSPSPLPFLLPFPSPSPGGDNIWISIVAQDGSGTHKTINEALSQIPTKGHDHSSVKMSMIYVKAGVYQEYVMITKKMKNIFLIGDGPNKTRITGNRSVKGGFKTFKTATVVVNGDNFMAKDISFENTAGAYGNQAVALRVTSDKSVIQNCYIDGYQDSLYAHAHRQFYRDCTISGTVDFIFGDATAVFQNCKILVKQPGSNHNTCIITAQGRSDNRSSTGFVFQNCTITADQNYTSEKKNLTSFLGRPWRKYSRTMIMESHIDDLIDPTGWTPWAGEEENALTLWYGEFLNRGPGSDLSKRVNWLGFHKNIENGEAFNFIPSQFIDSDHWIPRMGLPYFSNFATPTLN